MEFKDGRAILNEKELKTYRSIRNSLVSIGEPELSVQANITGNGIEFPDHGLMMGFLARGISQSKEAGIARRTRRSAARMIKEYVAAEKEGLVVTPPHDRKVL